MVKSIEPLDFKPFLRYTGAMDNNLILGILKKIPLLAELNEQDHAEVIQHITLQYFPANYTLFNEGDAGDKLYIIKAGMVKIFHPVEDPALAVATPDQAVAMLGGNDFFGEMALYEEKPRSASAQTMEESEIFILNKQDFFSLVLKNQSISSKMSEEFLRRVQENKK